MEIDLFELLSKNPTLLLFTVIGLGYILGKINLRGIQLGQVTGVLIVSLFFGHIGFEGHSIAATFGFTIFIFCVGVQAGPSFFSVFLRDGSRYLALALIVSLSAIACALAFSKILNLNFGLAAGTLAGALTSTPTLVGAQDAVSSGLAHLPDGMSKKQAIKNISVAYSLTYLLGLVGLIFFINYIPKFFRIDLPAEAKKISAGRNNAKNTINEDNLPIIRAYKITKTEGDNKTIQQIQDNTNEYFTILLLRRGKEIIEPNPDTILKDGDYISVIASISQHSVAKKKLAQEIFDKEMLNFLIISEDIVVTSDEFTSKPIKDLKLSSLHGCYPIGITRSGIELPLNQNMVLEKGDILHIMGEEQRVKDLGEKIGSVEKDIEETDLLTLTLGVMGGLILGSIVLKFGNFSIGLGSAGGLLIVGILIGFVRSVYPTFGNFPPAARNILMDFGIVILMSSIGLNAGSGIIDAFSSVGPTIILCGLLTTIVPVLLSFLFGKHVLKLNQALLLGAITGAMTSTPALKMVTNKAKSHVPALGYAGTYTFANVLLTFAGTLLVTL